MSANFAKAVESLQKAQQEFETPHKDMTNAYLGNKYASLDSCISAIKPALHKNGFALVQSGGKDEFGTLLIQNLFTYQVRFFQVKFILS